MTKELYESDYYGWLQESIDKTKNLNLEELGLIEIVNHLEEMSRREKHALGSYLVVLMHHLLKWKHQADRRTQSWKHSIDNSRDEINILLRRNPSIRPLVYTLAIEDYDFAIKKAKRETGIATFPQELEFTLEQLMDDDFYPDEP
jgi:hypothetical protein